jgi:hypothetical protein
MRSSIRLVLVGLSVALIASALARMLQPESAGRPRAVAVDVVVAARDIDIGQVLAADGRHAPRSRSRRRQWGAPRRR